MTTNVDGWEVWREDDVIIMRFVDIFGEGEEIRLPLDDARPFFQAGMVKCLGDKKKDSNELDS